MARGVPIILRDIIQAIDGIEAAVNRKTFEEFADDWLVKHGVQRGIEIISEAARHLPDTMLAAHPDVPWRQIRGAGNVLRHEYHRVSDRIIWSVVTEHLSPLRTAVEQMIVELGGDAA